MFYIAFNHLLQEKTEKRRIHFVFKVGPVSSETRPVVLSLLEVHHWAWGRPFPMKWCFMGAPPCQNSHVYHASPANTCLFLFSSHLTSHPSTKTWVHKFSRGRNYRLSSVSYDIWAEKKTSWRTLSLTNPGCHWPPAEPGTTAKSPHSDWTHRKAGPFNAKHIRMFYSTKSAVEPFYCVIQ